MGVTKIENFKELSSKDNFMQDEYMATNNAKGSNFCKLNFKVTKIEGAPYHHGRRKYIYIHVIDKCTFLHVL